MTKEEKLFFLDYININEYDYVIDFGGADGTLIKEIQKHHIATVSNEGLNFHHIAYFIIDNYFVGHSDCKFDGFKEDTYIKSSLKELDKILNPKGKILLILSSVLHELNENSQFAELYYFISKYVDTIVVRDMCFSSNRIQPNDKEWNFIYQLVDNEPKFKEVMDLTKGNSVLISLYEYLLKYEFEYNWENEIKEFYLHNNIKLFETWVYKLFDLTYEKNYILPYRKKKVKEDFGFDMVLPTHRQIILERKIGTDFQKELIKEKEEEYENNY